jgi:hypothetical protein
MRASWSLFTILGLITWILGAEVLADAAPDATDAAVWSAAVVTAVAFLACLLAHADAPFGPRREDLGLYNR